jgi:hypothetical protein
MDQLHNIQSVPVIRNQKSQGTYRPTYQRANQLITQQMNQEKHSQSEIYDLHSQYVVNEFSSQMKYNELNDLQVTIAPQLSQDSETGTQMETSHKQEHVPSKQGDRPHPFSGPKLHLFKKGQSKSSQMKSRKIKTSTNNQRMVEMHSQQNVVYSQQDASSSHQFYPQRQQLSEGGPTYQRNFNSFKKEVKSKNGHINISEILKGNRHNGILAMNLQGNIDQMYADGKSQNSQGMISQSSYEIGQGTPIENQYQKEHVKQTLLDFDTQSKNGANGPSSSIEPFNNMQSSSFKQQLHLQ